MSSSMAHNCIDSLSQYFLGIVKVKVMGARDLPVMDRASDLTDAFVEVRYFQSLYQMSKLKLHEVNIIYKTIKCYVQKGIRKPHQK